MNRGRAAGFAAASFSVGLFVWFYRGPYWTSIRGTLGDVAVVVFGVAVLGVIGKGPAWSHLVFMAGLSVGIELLQLLELVDKNSPWWAHLIFGSTFDPIDLALYGVGLALAAAAQRTWISED